MVIVMSDQKIENLLNLAAGSTNSEKEKSENLGVGFDPQTDTWEIIVKYTGDILALESRYPGIRIVPLLGQYAIVTIRQMALHLCIMVTHVCYQQQQLQRNREMVLTSSR